MSRIPKPPQPSPSAPVRHRGRTGKGLSVSPIAVHTAALVCVLSLGLFGVPAYGVSGPASTDVDDIKVGDCFNSNDDLKDYQGEGTEAPLTVDVVPCDQPHQSEAYAVFNLEDGPYPGEKKIASIADEKCSGKALTDYVGANAKLPETVTIYDYYPQSGNWVLDDRAITCFLADTNGKSTGSFRATGS
ncbi:septum formation family protein [Streptomyces sp. NPDC058289]|uniref:septum formation family protein n=1 Tax=Streptomyces sp. NPDC058289 TaxID=3346425 RepID=UPI0036EC942F